MKGKVLIKENGDFEVVGEVRERVMNSLVLPDEMITSRIMEIGKINWKCNAMWVKSEKMEIEGRVGEG